MRLDPQEAARLLDVRPATLERWVRQGLLRPADARGNFERAELERWARQRGLTLAGEGKRRWAPGQDLFADALERGALLVAPPCTNASEAIECAVGAVPDLAPAPRARLLEEVLGRERMASTGLGSGVAVPHPRTPPKDLIAEPLVVALLLDSALDWAALDGEPVHTVFLLLSPSAPVHLELLTRVAIALRSEGFVEHLRARPTKAELIGRLRTLSKEV